MFEEVSEVVDELKKTTVYEGNIQIHVEGCPIVWVRVMERMQYALLINDCLLELEMKMMMLFGWSTKAGSQGIDI